MQNIEQQGMHDTSKDMDQAAARELLQFIDQSPSCYHVIDNFKKKLAVAGFIEAREEDAWNLKRGEKYFCIRGGSSIIAFAVPEVDYTNFQIVASHSDSPSFKIKENPEMLTDSHYIELNVEKYGGMIYAPWLDRPLSVAGRVIVNHNGALESRLVNIDRDLVMIPNVAIHMNREVNEGYKYNAQKDMIPLFGEETAKGQFMKLVAENVDANEEDICGSDLFLYNRVKGSIWGAGEEFISSAKLDDLECAYTSMKALIDVTAGKQNCMMQDDSRCQEMKSFSDWKQNPSILVCAVFDNEEVGSQTKQGAASTFAYDVLHRINGAFKNGQEDYYRTIAQSFMVSADNAHAVHPHHQDKADPTNRPYMNQGIVIKYNANQKYTTDSISAAVFKSICANASVPVQSYINRSDIAGGSTLGNIANSHISLNTIDIGLAQLAMHSPYETAGVRDIAYLRRGLEEFYGTHIAKNEQGAITLA